MTATPLPADAPPAPLEDSVRLVLCMIVRDEAAILARCLESALPLVDGYVVCDTGSRDETVAVLERSAARFGTPGLLLHHPWRDFGHNRTRAAHEARRWALSQGWSPARTYLLFLDADMVLRADPGFDRGALAASSYSVLQDDGEMRYANIRLACLAHHWEAVGPTHEYWRPVGGGPDPEPLDSLYIHDLGDGGSKAGKYARDIQLLRRGVLVDPGNPRYTYYLAQSYFDIGRWGEAARWYARRCKLGGWDQERWHARYRHGVSVLKLGDTERAAGILLRAFDERPTRAEPLYALARHYREEERYHAALALARRGLEIPYPDADTLFVEKQVYEWRLWEEVMICAYYTGAENHPLGLEACERLLARPGHDPAFYEYVTGNQRYYQPLYAWA